jgi:hypothetical protein
MHRYLHHHHYTRARLLPTLFGLMRIILPILVLLWLMMMAVAKVSSPKLRGTEQDAKAQALAKPGLVAQVKTPAAKPNHAIIVAGHAVVQLNKLNRADKDDSAWYLLSYQKNQGFPSIITSHIKKGIELAKRDAHAALLFSGGQTRDDVGPLSEAASYYYLAKEKAWMSGIEKRTYLEEYARDSFENLLFSLCRFKEATGRYPERVTVVGFDFKGHRFSDLHRAAIGFPDTNFTYVGLRPESSKFLHDRAASGELIAASQFRKDMYGCSNAALAKKRDSRNPFKRTIPYELACPELKALLKWCGPGLFDTETLPWSKHMSTEQYPREKEREKEREGVHRRNPATA